VLILELKSASIVAAQFDQGRSNMASFKDQHKTGIPDKPRGQQTGFAGNPDQNREEKKKTPAIKGVRPRANKLARDVSQQQLSSDPVKPNTNVPSTVTRDVKSTGGGGGAAGFKKRLAKQRDK
jgi:hypothetical protein